MARVEYFPVQYFYSPYKHNFSALVPLTLNEDDQRDRLLIANCHQLCSLTGANRFYRLQRIPLDGAPFDSDIIACASFRPCAYPVDSHPLIAVAFNRRSRVTVVHGGRDASRDRGDTFPTNRRSSLIRNSGRPDKAGALGEVLGSQHQRDSFGVGSPLDLGHSVDDAGQLTLAPRGAHPPGSPGAHAISTPSIISRTDVRNMGSKVSQEERMSSGGITEAADPSSSSTEALGSATTRGWGKSFLYFYGVNADPFDSLPKMCMDYQNVEISYTPIGMTSVQTIVDGNQVEAFLVWDDEQRVHAYCLGESEDSGSSNRQMLPVQPEIYGGAALPELESLSHVPLKIDIRHRDNDRLTTIGFDRGHVEVWLTPTGAECLHRSPTTTVGGHAKTQAKPRLIFSALLDGPITGCIPFRGPYLGGADDYNDDRGDEYADRENNAFPQKPGKNCLNLLAASAAGDAIIFSGIDTDSTKSAEDPPPVILQSLVWDAEFDSVLSVAIADVELAGRRNLLLGTFDGHVLVFSVIETPDEYPPFRYSLEMRHLFEGPVYGIQVGDYDNDAVDEIIVVTLDGVHVLAADSEAVTNKVLQALESVKPTEK